MGTIRLAFAGLLLLAGCAAPPARPGLSEVQQQVAGRLTQSVQWKQGAQDDAAAAQALRALLSDTLSLDEAVQVALLSNPNLQATYERLGIAQADLLQAGLLANPVFSVGWQSSSHGGGASKREFGVTQDILGLLTVVPRKQLAGAAFEATTLQVALDIMSVALQVKAAYVELEGVEQNLELAAQVLTATEAAAQLAQRQYAAGTLSLREQRLHQAFHAQVMLDVAQLEARRLTQREKLNRLLGLWGADTRWEVPKRLPEVPVILPAVDRLESAAIAQRLDLALLKREREWLWAALTHTKDFRLLSALGIGYSYEKDSGASAIHGPNLHLGLPLFDRAQASIARLQARVRETERQLEALAIEIRSEVREAYGQLQAAHASVQHYRATLLPVHQDIVSETQKFHNGMLLGVYDLLRAKQDQINVARDYLLAIRDFWLAQVALEKALGGPAPPPLAAALSTHAAHQSPSQPSTGRQP